MVQRCFLGLHCALGPHPENFPLRLVCMSSQVGHTIVWLSKQRDNLAPAHPSQLWVLRTTPVCSCHTPVYEPSGIGVTLWSETPERTTLDGYGACQQCLQTRALQQWLRRPCDQLHTKLQRHIWKAFISHGCCLGFSPFVCESVYLLWQKHLKEQGLFVLYDREVTASGTWTH